MFQAAFGGLFTFQAALNRVDTEPRWACRSKMVVTMARPGKYTNELADKICARIADGESLRTICAGKDMPAASTVHRWLAENQEFSEQYAHAREMQADAFAESIIRIADEVEPESAAVAKAKLQIDARKWTAAKLAPKKYGDKIDLSGDMRVQVETRSLEDIFK